MSEGISKRRVVLAYSGGLDTSVAIPWIKENYGAEVTTLTLDVGQEGELGDALERAKLNGASDAIFLDVKETFAREYIFPALKANALYQGVYPLSTSLARPLVVKHLVKVAKEQGADTVAHGCTGKGNDQVRFDVGVQTLDGSLSIVAPVRDWDMNRTDELAYAKARGLKIHQKPESPYSVDENLWGRSVEGGCLEDPASPPPEEVFQWTSHPGLWPDQPESLRIGFVQGSPTSVDGIEMGPVQLISLLNKCAGAHGVGRIDHVEDRVVGIKSRETYECPGAIALIAAHQALESLVLPRDLLSFKAGVDKRFSEIVYEGFWYSPLRLALQAFVEETQATVTGEVTLNLFKGTVRVSSRTSEYSLLSKSLVTYDKGSVFPQKAAEGFIRLYGMANRTAYAAREKAIKKKTEVKRSVTRPVRISPRQSGVPA